MTDRSKFEQMLEHLINEEQDKAKELFHQLVVEKSREIYENILAEDFTNEEKDEDDEEPGAADDEVTENFGEIAENPFDEDEPKHSFGGDPTDDFISDVEKEPVDHFDDEGGEEEHEFGLGDEEPDKEEILDAVEKLEDLLQRFLDAEDGEGDEDMGDSDEDSDEDSGDDLGDLEDDEGPTEESLGESVKLSPVSAPKHGDDGVNTKPVVAKKNDMGGTAGNIVRGDEEKGKGGTAGGLANPTVKDMNTGNVNVVGNKKAPKLQSVSKPKHGDDGDKGAGSPLNGAPKRAK